MKTKTKKILMTIAGIASVAWLVVVMTVDVGAVGPKGTKVGLSLINSSFHDLWHYDDVGNALYNNYNIFWYNVTKYIGVLSLACVGAFGLIGLYQLIKRKSLLKVDNCILALGGLYIVVLAFYIFFEIVIINYRPVIMPDETMPAASFPSSHTMLTITVMGSIMILLKNYIKKTLLRMSIQFFCLIVIITMVLGRFICGVHWFSDLIGGILISLFLLAAYSIFAKNKEESKA
ncbi:MAG: phosphatase PAP2 family protein [Lachnospiraceae bacterium]|nr:phosphatase PAP2 family protein [Lachnospiraceae bacterium]